MHGPPDGRACCVGVRPHQLWGVLCRCVAPPMVARAVLEGGPPYGRPCCVVVWPSSLWAVLCWCVAGLMVGHALLLPVRRRGCACCGRAWLGLSSCVPPGGRRRCVQVGGACGGVSAGAMRSLFCLFGVVFASIRSACLSGCGRRLICGSSCVDRLAGVGSVLVRGPPHGGARCIGACPPPMVGCAVLVCGPPMVGRAVLVFRPPAWWDVLCCCVAPLMVGRAALVPAGHVGGAWCGGVWLGLSPLLGCGCGCVVCLAVVGAVLVRGPPLPGRAVFVRAPPPMVGLAVLVCNPPHGGVCCVGLWPPSLWGVLCWCVAPLLVGSAVLVPARRGGGAWFGGVCFWLSSSVGWVAVAVVLFACQGSVLCWCVPPLPCWGVPCLCVAHPLVGHPVSACSGFSSWCCSRLDARLVLLVRCCLRRRTSGVVGCWLSVLFSWPGFVLCWCVPRPLLGRAVFVRGPLHGGACCVGMCPPPWWGVLRWFVAPLMVGRAVLVRGTPPGGACCVGACPPLWWFFWLGFSSSVGWVAVAVALFAWPGLVPCWCVAPPLLGRAAFLRGAPLGGACCVGVFRFQFLVLDPARCSACFVSSLLSPPLYGRRCRVLVVCGVCLACAPLRKMT